MVASGRAPHHAARIGKTSGFLGGFGPGRDRQATGGRGGRSRPPGMTPCSRAGSCDIRSRIGATAVAGTGPVSASMAFQAQGGSACVRAGSGAIPSGAGQTSRLCCEGHVTTGPGPAARAGRARLRVTEIRMQSRQIIAALILEGRRRDNSRSGQRLQQWAGRRARRVAGAFPPGIAPSILSRPPPAGEGNLMQHPPAPRRPAKGTPRK